MMEFFVGLIAGGIFFTSLLEAYRQGYLDWFKKKHSDDGGENHG